MSPKRGNWTENRPMVKRLFPLLNALVRRLRWSPGAAASTLRSVAARIFVNVASVQESELLSLWLITNQQIDIVIDVALNILAEDDVCSHDVLYAALTFVRNILGIRSTLEQTLDLEERRGDLQQQPTLEKRKILVEAVIKRLSCSGDEDDIRPDLASVVVQTMLTSMIKLSQEDVIELIRKVFPHIDDYNPEVRQRMTIMYSAPTIDRVYREEILRLCAETPSFTYQEGKLLRAGKLFASDAEGTN
jgi:hypothetical protein